MEILEKMWQLTKSIKMKLEIEMFISQIAGVLLESLNLK